MLFVVMCVVVLDCTKQNRSKKMAAAANASAATAKPGTPGPQVAAAAKPADGKAPTTGGVATATGAAAASTAAANNKTQEIQLDVDKIIERLLEVRPPAVLVFARCSLSKHRGVMLYLYGGRFVVNVRANT